MIPDDLGGVMAAHSAGPGQDLSLGQAARSTSEQSPERPSMTVIRLSVVGTGFPRAWPVRVLH
jgi:microcystin degradation protein MlrC